MYSVVDIAGRNGVLDTVLSNAAGAVSGMARIYSSNSNSNSSSALDKEKGVRIGISMFGVTTPAVMSAKEYFEKMIADCEVYIFHATGSGGRALERLVREGRLDAVLDLTTTEICDEVVGGVVECWEAEVVCCDGEGCAAGCQCWGL